MKNVILMLNKAEELGVGINARDRLFPIIRRAEKILSNVIGEQLTKDSSVKLGSNIDFRRLLIRAGIGLESNDDVLIRVIVDALYKNRDRNRFIVLTSYEKRLLAIDDYVGYTISFLSRVTGREEIFFKDITMVSSDIVGITRR